MVAPLIIIAIIGIIGATVVLTPVGDILGDVLDQSGFIPENPGTIIEDEGMVEEEIVGGFEAFILEMIGLGGDMGQDAIDNSEFEGNPIGMTREEAEDINHKGIDFFTAFAEVFFTGHAFIVSLINGLSPVEMGVALVSILALLVTFYLMIKHGKHIGHHWLIIIMVVASVMLVLIIFGSEASI